MMLVNDFMKYVHDKQEIKVIGDNKELFRNFKSRLKSDKLLNREVDYVTCNLFNELVIIVK